MVAQKMQACQLLKSTLRARGVPAQMTTRGWGEVTAGQLELVHHESHQLPILH